MSGRISTLRHPGAAGAGAEPDIQRRHGGGHRAGHLGGVLAAERQGSAHGREVGTVPVVESVDDVRASRVQGTLTAAAVSIVLALLLGFVLGVGRMSPLPDSLGLLGLRGVLPRGPGADHDDLRVLPFREYDVFPSKHLALAGVITGLTLYNGAVIAEIVRAGVNALPRGRRKQRPRSGCAGARRALDPAARRPLRRCCRC